MTAFFLFDGSSSLLSRTNRQPDERVVAKHRRLKSRKFSFRIQVFSLPGFIHHSSRLIHIFKTGTYDTSLCPCLMCMALSPARAKRPTVRLNFFSDLEIFWDLEIFSTFSFSTHSSLYRKSRGVAGSNCTFLPFSERVAGCSPQLGRDRPSHLPTIHSQ